MVWEDMEDMVWEDMDDFTYGMGGMGWYGMAWEDMEDILLPSPLLDSMCPKCSRVA